MDEGAWKAAGHEVAEGRTGLSSFAFTFHFHALEKEMATHSSVLAWRIPETREPGGLLSMGLHRVRHDWSDLAGGSMVKNLSAYAWDTRDTGLIPGSGRSCGEGILHISNLAWEIPWAEMDYNPWGHKESDTTEILSTYRHYVEK